MKTIDPTTVLLAVNHKPIRKLGIDWRDALNTVAALSARQPGLTTQKAIEQTVTAFSEAEGVLTLGDAAVDALLSSAKAQDCSSRDKLRRWELAKCFSGDQPFPMKAEEIVFVQEALAEHYKPGIYGPAYDALNAPATSA